MPDEKKETSKVLVLYLGGTIGMCKDENNLYVPKEGMFFEKIKGQPELHDSELATNNKIPDDHLVLRLEDHVIIYQIREYSPLLDSSNMSHKDWIKVAKDIEKLYRDFDGFLILHGTDTLSYTAAALSFMLQGLEKSVIITGSQISIFEPRSDAKANFLNSLILAGRYRIPEVTVFFSNKLMRGNRTVKLDSQILDAFASPNYPELVHTDIVINIRKELILSPSGEEFRAQTSLDPNVVILTMFPTITLQLFRSFFEPPIKGVIMRSFGIGNFPTCRTELLDFLEKKAAEEIIIVNVSQCSYGGVGGGVYETGGALVRIGVIPGYDMTAATALTKLCYVLGFPNKTFQQKKDMMRESLKGEMSIPNTNNNNVSNNNFNL